MSLLQRYKCAQSMASFCDSWNENKNAIIVLRVLIFIRVHYFIIVRFRVLLLIVAVDKNNQIVDC
jgi:hypothetical protein